MSPYREVLEKHYPHIKIGNGTITSKSPLNTFAKSVQVQSKERQS